MASAPSLVHTEPELGRREPGRTGPELGRTEPEPGHTVPEEDGLMRGPGRGRSGRCSCSRKCRPAR